jgi:predicted membrane protein
MRHRFHHHHGRHRQQHRIAFGILFIVGGLLALLDNLHLLNIGNLWDYWPMAFCVFGISHLFQSRRFGGLIWGGGLAALGIVLTLQNVGIVHHVMQYVWPSILILFGVAFVAKAFRPHEEIPMTDPTMHFDSHDNIIKPTAIMGGTTLRSDSKDFRGGEITAIMGGLELDLRQAAIETQAVLHVYAVCGGVEIKVPQGWQVVNQVAAIMGGVDDKTIPPMHDAKTLVLEGEVILGGVEIKH